MPTLQITPDAPNLLQNVADTLAKSRKMVIITGAGISTNSGIPDFRSEHGLYSLIQDQFERAEANLKKGDSQDHDTAAAAPFDISDRPLKRRRMSGPDSSASTSALLPPKSSLSQEKSVSQNQTEPREGLTATTCVIPSPDPRNVPAQRGQVEAVAPPDSSRRQTRSQATALRPKISRHLTQNSVDSSTSRDTVFSSQPLACESSQTDNSTAEHTPLPIRSCTPIKTPDRPVALVTTSSPLSSPPPLFDPYENAESSTDSCSHEDSDCSDLSETDDTQQSLDVVSSQASNPNLRNMKGRDLFDCNIWADPLKTSVFYRFITTLRQRVKDIQPTITHRFIAQMRDVGKLARVYTQNIDEIEKKIGLSTDLNHGVGNKKRKSTKQPLESSEKEEVTESPDDVVDGTAIDTTHLETTQSKPRPQINPIKGVECVFLHGSLHALRCFACGKLCDWDEDDRESRTLSGEQPECPHCAGATAARLEKGKRGLSIGKLRPDIVLYGEEHPQSDLISPIVQHDLAAGPDLLLVLGTSLRVHGLKVMVKEFAKAVHTKGGKVIFINFSKPSESAWGDVLDYWIEWDCDAWVEDLKARKPLLWLSPDERLALDKQKRETLAEKKRETSKKRETINEKKRDTPGDKRQQPSEQIKTRPPPKNPVAMRNDYQCGAYVVWEIFRTLARIGDRPFDNLGYSQPTSLPNPNPVPPSPKPVPREPELPRKPEPTKKPEPTTKPKLPHEPPLPCEPAPPCDPVVVPQKEPKIQKKRNRKPRPKKSVQGQTTAQQPLPLPPHSNPITSPIPTTPPITNSSSIPTMVGVATFNSQTTQPSTPYLPTIQPSTPYLPITQASPPYPSLTQPSTPFVLTDKPSTQKRRRTRKSAPTTLMSKVSDTPEKKEAKKEVKKRVRREKQTSKDQYLDAARELSRQRKPSTPGHAAPVNRVPFTPAPIHSRPQPQYLGSQSTHSFSYFVGPEDECLDEGNERRATHSASNPTQPYLLPPLPYSSRQPAQAPVTECPQGPDLPPLNAHWGDSPPSITPMEIAPHVGPESPLVEISPGPSNPAFSYTHYHAAQPIYNGPLVGISRQGIAQKPQWHMESNDENTPSPSDQLHMEAANRLWRLRGRT